MRWNKVSDWIPQATDKHLLRSDAVLCQNISGETFIGYVRYIVDMGLDPIWTQRGRDMYNLEGIVRWIPLREVVDNIEG